MGVLESEPAADRPEERIIEIEMERLQDFRNHPFRIKKSIEVAIIMQVLFQVIIDGIIGGICYESMNG